MPKETSTTWEIGNSAAVDDFPVSLLSARAGDREGCRNNRVAARAAAVRPARKYVLRMVASFSEGGSLDVQVGQKCFVVLALGVLLFLEVLDVGLVLLDLVLLVVCLLQVTC